MKKDGFNIEFKLAKLEILLKQEVMLVSKKRKKITGGVISVLFSVITSLFWAWCSSSNTSNMLDTKNFSIFGFSVFDFIILMIPQILIFSAFVYVFIDILYIKSIKKDMKLTIFYWSLLLSLYILHFYHIDQNSEDSFETMFKKINKIDDKQLKKSVFLKVDVINFLSQSYIDDNFIFSNDFYLYLYEYCILHASKLNYINIKSKDSFTLNVKKIREYLYKGINFDTYKT